MSMKTHLYPTFNASEIAGFGNVWTTSVFLKEMQVLSLPLAYRWHIIRNCSDMCEVLEHTGCELGRELIIERRRNCTHGGRDLVCVFKIRRRFQRPYVSTAMLRAKDAARKVGTLC